jgi:hypothetical protein
MISFLELSSDFDLDITSEDLFCWSRHINTFHIIRFWTYLMSIQDGATALIISAHAGNESVLTLLLEAKADVNHVNSVRHSFLEYLTEFRYHFLCLFSYCFWLILSLILELFIYFYGDVTALWLNVTYVWYCIRMVLQRLLWLYVENIRSWSYCC